MITFMYRNPMQRSRCVFIEKAEIKAANCEDLVS